MYGKFEVHRKTKTILFITLTPITFSASLNVKINLFKIKKQNMQKK